MDLTFMRQGYQNEGLTKEQLSPDPFLQFEAWFKEANEAEPIPNAMSLATVNHSGAPMMRTVLLSCLMIMVLYFSLIIKAGRPNKFQRTQMLRCFLIGWLWNVK